jgi:hypothetical protein
MRDLHQLDLDPDPRFGARLEATLVDELTTPTLADDPATTLEAPVPIDLEPRPEQHVSRRPTIWPLIAGAAVLVVALVAAGLVVRDAQDPGPTTVPAVSTSRDVTFSIEHGVLEGASSFSESARIWDPIVSPGQSAVTKVSGDVIGSATGLALANSNTADHDGAEFVFSFLIDTMGGFGCGSGQMLVVATAEYFEVDGDVGVDDPDGRWSGTWQVAPYSGRGDLVGISGSGSLSGSLLDQALGFTGSFDCHGSPVNPPTP